LLPPLPASEEGSPTEQSLLMSEESDYGSPVEPQSPGSFWDKDAPHPRHSVTDDPRHGHSGVTDNDEAAAASSMSRAPVPSDNLSMGQVLRRWQGGEFLRSASDASTSALRAFDDETIAAAGMNLGASSHADVPPSAGNGLRDIDNEMLSSPSVNNASAGSREVSMGYALTHRRNDERLMTYGDVSVSDGAPDSVPKVTLFGSHTDASSYLGFDDETSASQEGSSLDDHESANDADDAGTASRHSSRDPIQRPGYGEHVPYNRSIHSGPPRPLLLGRMSRDSTPEPEIPAPARRGTLRKQQPPAAQGPSGLELALAVAAPHVVELLSSALHFGATRSYVTNALDQTNLSPWLKYPIEAGATALAHYLLEGPVRDMLTANYGIVPRDAARAFPVAGAAGRESLDSNRMRQVQTLSTLASAAGALAGIASYGAVDSVRGVLQGAERNDPTSKHWAVLSAGFGGMMMQTVHSLAALTLKVNGQHTHQIRVDRDASPLEALVADFKPKLIDTPYGERDETPAGVALRVLHGITVGRALPLLPGLVAADLLSKHIPVDTAKAGFALGALGSLGLLAFGPMQSRWNHAESRGFDETIRNLTQRGVRPLSSLLPSDTPWQQTRSTLRLVDEIGTMAQKLFATPPEIATDAAAMGLRGVSSLLGSMSRLLDAAANGTGIELQRQRDSWLGRPQSTATRSSAFIEEVGEDDFEEAALHAPGSVDFHRWNEVLAKDYFANGAGPVVTAFSRRFSDAYPRVRAHGQAGYFVESPDGKMRRFPIDKGTHSFITGPETMGRSLQRQLDWIYDSHRDHVRETIGEYHLDPATQTVTYDVRGQGVRSIRNDQAIYPLENGKWMIPQHEFRACTYAVEDMLLAEGKSADQVRKQTKHSFQAGETQRRPVEDMASSLHARSGKRAIVVKGIDPHAPDSLDRLKNDLEKHGPCALSVGGHVRVLDRIERTPDGEHVLDVRDPFTGSALRINMHDEFARRPDDEDRPLWDLVFLKHGSDQR
jgi:hypothetical protein